MCCSSCSLNSAEASFLGGMIRTSYVCRLTCGWMLRYVPTLMCLQVADALRARVEQMERREAARDAELAAAHEALREARRQLMAQQPDRADGAAAAAPRPSDADRETRKVGCMR